MVNWLNCLQRWNVSLFWWGESGEGGIFDFIKTSDPYPQSSHLWTSSWSTKCHESCLDCRSQRLPINALTTSWWPVTNSINDLERKTEWILADFEDAGKLGVPGTLKGRPSLEMVLDKPEDRATEECYSSKEKGHILQWAGTTPSISTLVAGRSLVKRSSRQTEYEPPGSCPWK